MNFRSQILNILHSTSESRSMLAKQLGVTKAYVTKITAALISEGIIKEVSQQDKPFGRPATLLTVIPGIWYSVNVLIRNYTLMATLNDFRADIPALASTERTLEEKVSPEMLVDIINEVTEHLMLRAGLVRSQVVQTSIALQGGIEQKTGVVRWCPVLDTRNVPLKDMLQKGCRTGISVMNIAWCSCYMLSALYEKDGSWLAFMPGYGSLGFGYWLNGEPALGENGFYPEIVHLPYTGGIENAFVFDASDPDASAAKAAEALFFAICCTAPVHNISNVLLTGEFFDEAPEWTISQVQQQLTQHPDECISTIRLNHIKSAPELSHRGLIRLSSDAITEMQP